MSRRSRPPALAEGDAAARAANALLRQAKLDEPTGTDETAAREAIWRELSRTLPAAGGSRARRWPWVVGAGVAGLAAVSAFLLLQPPRTAELELTAGAVFARDSDGRWQDVQPGPLLSAERQLRTAERSQALLAVDRAAVLLAPGSEMALEGEGRRTALRLHAGSLVARVAPRHLGQTFVVQTDVYRVTVVGTVFSVAQRAADDVEVSVRRGTVEVAGKGRVWRVSAGQSWRSREPAVLGSDDITESSARLLELTDGPGPRAAIAVSGSSQLQVSADELEFGSLPIQWNAPVGRYHFVGLAENQRAEGEAATAPGIPAALTLLSPAAPAVSLRPPAKVAVSVQAPLSRPLPPVPNPARAPVKAPVQAATVVPPVAPSAPPADPYGDALALARQGRDREAAEAFARLATSGGVHADLALYELAQLRQSRFADRPGALAAYREYQTRYPKGSLRQEVALSVIDLTVHGSDPGAARSEMDRFLREHPDSERAPEVYLLRGNLRRQAGDCRGAIADYGQSLHGTASLADDALYYSAWCRERLGSVADTRSALRLYLARFPAGKHTAAVKQALMGGP